MLGASTGEVSAVYRRARAVATVSALRSLEMAGTLDAARYRRDVMRGKSAGKSTPAPPAGPGNGEEERDFAGRMQITRAIHAEMEGAGYRLLNSRDLDLVDLLCSDYVGRLLVRVNDSAIDPRPVVALQDADAGEPWVLNTHGCSMKLHARHALRSLEGIHLPCPARSGTRG